MNNEQIIKLARQAGGYDYDSPQYPENMVMDVHDLSRFAALVAQAEREARQAAQAENEQLKAQIARSGVELRSAVLAEREEWRKALLPAITSRMGAEQVREAIQSVIRARNHVEQPLPMVNCTDCDCADNEPCKSGIALESGEFIPAESIPDWSAA